MRDAMVATAITMFYDNLGVKKYNIPTLKVFKRQKPSELAAF